MNNPQSGCARDDEVPDLSALHLEDSGYGGSSHQSLDNGSPVSSSRPHPPEDAGAQHIPIRPIAKPIDPQTARHANDLIEQMSGLLAEYMMKSSKRRKYLSRTKRQLPAMAIRPIMLGTSTENAKACLVIFCSDQDGAHETIRRFLRKQFVKDLYQPNDNAMSSFDVHIFGESPRTQYGIEVGIPRRLWESSLLSTCGIPIYIIKEDCYTKDVMATMGGTIQIKSTLNGPDVCYGLTVAHGINALMDFNHDTDEEDDDDDLSISDDISESDESSSTSSSESNDSPLQIDWGTSIEAVHEPSRVLLWNPISDAILKQSVAYSALRNTRAFRDWALFDASELQSRPNLLVVGETIQAILAEPAATADIANISSNRLVSIMTGLAGVKYATLLPYFSQILLQPGTEFVRAFTLELDKESEIVQGDSGSWVVDSLNFEVYGHLVATDKLVGSYVIPLVDIFDDIKLQIPQASIKFPPLQTSPGYIPSISESTPLQSSHNCSSEEEDGGSEGGDPSIVSSPWTTTTYHSVDTGAGKSVTEFIEKPVNQNVNRELLFQPPPWWTASHDRKLIRAYLYTTMSLENIVPTLSVNQVVPWLSIESTDRAVARLLDKKPQWLRPTSENDMNFRIQQLERSSIRKLLSHSVEPAPSDSKAAELGDILEDYSGQLLEGFKKATTIYSVVPNDQDSTSDGEAETFESSRRRWLHDKDAPSVGSPSPIAGDFLQLDVLLTAQGYCGPGLPTHDKRSCVCRANEEVLSEDLVSAEGLTPKASDILRNFDPNCRAMDSFGNTTLHLIAARYPIGHPLLEAIAESSDLALSALNAAHQTFLHVLGPSWFLDARVEDSLLRELLRKLRSRGFDIYIRDIYGRSFFHHLQANIHNRDIIDDFLKSYDHDQFTRRDAFGLVPNGSGNKGKRISVLDIADGPDGSSIRNRSQIMDNIRLTRGSPLMEDTYGRNGLHLIADATVSTDTVRQILGSTSNRELRRKSREMDSSALGLSIRKSLVEELISVGVDVNHYREDGNTVLMAFVARLPEDDNQEIQCEILRLLIEAGANVAARNRYGETALHIAVRTGHKLAIRTLVEADANVYVRDGEGRSLLDVADIKIMHERDVKKYAHLEAIRAWLTGIQGRAVQSPTVKQEWGRKENRAAKGKDPET